MVAHGQHSGAGEVTHREYFAMISGERCRSFITCRVLLNTLTDSVHAARHLTNRVWINFEAGMRSHAGFVVSAHLEVGKCLDSYTQMQYAYEEIHKHHAKAHVPRYAETICIVDAVQHPH
jgi:hypothetical protein